MYRGYVKLWRKILDSQVFQSKTPDLCKVWLWCLVSATHTQRWVSIRTGRGSEDIKLQPGQFVYGRNSAAPPLGLSPDSVRRRMQKLSGMGNLTLKPHSHYTLVSICNWETYAGAASEAAQANAQATTRQRPGKRTGDDQALTTNKKEENEKKDEKGKKEEASPLRELNFPPPLDTPEFQAAWAKWVKHRTEIRKPLKPTQAAAQIEKFAEWGATRSVAAINHTVTQGWQGIREPEDSHGRTTGTGASVRHDPNNPVEAL